MKKDIFYKTQIEGFSNVEKTMRVIEKSAASHIHFLKKKVRALLAYKKQVQKKLHYLSHFYWNDNHPLLKQKTAGQNALLIITGKKGMVGGLYHKLINEAINKSNDYETIFVIGHKGKQYLNEEGVKTKQIFDPLDFDDLPGSEDINNMTSRLFELFEKSALKKIDVLYAGFISLGNQSPTITQFLPFDFTSANFAATPGKTLTNKPDEPADGIPIFEPSKKLMADKLLEKYIKVSFAEIILEAKLSEFSARTVTAESAIKETEQLIHTFSRVFLKMKRLTITQKQIESFSVHQLIL